MRNSRWRVCVAAVVVACAGPTGPDAGLPYVYALASCGPADGPAVTLTFSGTPYSGERVSPPYVLMTVYRPPTDLAGRTYTFDRTGDTASGVMIDASGAYVGAVTGTLQVDRVTGDNSVVAYVNAQLPDGSRLRRAFVAPWRIALVACG
ncbi:MAG: hypothetical protein IT355_20450 [Gemmatimonadaceae bacterium]|nr:hypothetical protein [Gemmatimonadaceae bacterium]